MIGGGSATFIADTHVVLPPLVDSEELAGLFFDRDRAGDRLNRMATRAARQFGIHKRPCVLDLEKLPEIALSDERHSPLNWGVQIVDHFLTALDRHEIGFLSVSYNITSHKDVLPNLACRIAMATGLKLDAPPQELAYYGCASGLYSIEAAVDYCRHRRKAAIVFCFDQCTWNLIRDIRPDHPNLKMVIRTNLLFSDGAVGLLIVPEGMRNRFQTPLPRIVRTMTCFEAGDILGMVDGDFFVGNEVPRVMPALVMQRLVRPAMEYWRVDAGDIAEWSIHQGGPAVLDEFCKEIYLGLSDQQMKPSRTLFRKYGNLSSPSCLFVLHHHFHDERSIGKENQYGAVLGFGAGYYMGMMVYRWVS